MTRAEAKAAILARIKAALFGADVLGLEFLYACGLEGSAAECDKLENEIASHVERALEDLKRTLHMEVEK